MKNKQLAKKRSKRLAHALGACRRCARLAALKTVIATNREGVMKASCPACGRELLATTEMLNESDGVLIRRYAQCLQTSDDHCSHAFTVLLDGEVKREDSFCNCGKPRLVLNMFSELGMDKEG